MISIQKYSVSVENVQILYDCSLQFNPGSVHVIMGPNGSGKSSLLFSVMGHPAYQIMSGDITVNQQNITTLSTYQKALQGLFLAVQHPIEIEGLRVLHFLQELARIYQKNFASSADFLLHIKKLLDVVGLPESILQRSVNVGFSGGEKKRFELLQLLLFQPKVIMLDEIDSGVDVDGLKMIAQVLLQYKQEHPESILIFVTHYRKIVDYIAPDFVHILVAGRLVQSGDASLLDSIETSGYDAYAKGS